MRLTMLGLEVHVASKLGNMRNNKTALNLITLAVLAVTDRHIDETLINIGHEAWVKCRDQSPKWLKVAAERIAPENSMFELIKNWDDNKNDIFDFDQDSNSEEIFKNFRKEKWNSNLFSLFVLPQSFLLMMLIVLIMLQPQ